MVQPTTEYRYSAAARQRARLWLGIGAFVSVSFLVVFLTRWGELNLLAQVLGLVLLIGLLFTVRGQLARLTYRCVIWPDRLEINAPLAKRTIPWQAIVEVRRMILPRFGGEERWACTVLTRGRSGNAIPTYVFDNQLEGAEAALREIVRHTAHAQHVNI